MGDEDAQNAAAKAALTDHSLSDDGDASEDDGGDNSGDDDSAAATRPADTGALDFGEGISFSGLGDAHGAASAAASSLAGGELLDLDSAGHFAEGSGGADVPAAAGAFDAPDAANADDPFAPQLHLADTATDSHDIDFGSADHDEGLLDRFGDTASDFAGELTDDLADGIDVLGDSITDLFGGD